MRATFDPGVRAPWHTHPRVWFAPSERHWRGAHPRSVFSYLSVQAVATGVYVRWMAPVGE